MRYFIRKTNSLLYRLFDNNVEVFNTDWLQSDYLFIAFEGPSRLSFFEPISEEQAKELYPEAFTK